MSSVRLTQHCCDPYCTNKKDLIEGNHCCIRCFGHMHVWCGFNAPGQEEGFGQKRICSKCKDASTSFSSTVASLISPPPSLSVTTNTNIRSKTPPPFEATKTTAFKPFKKSRMLMPKKKLPTNFTHRDPDTINFNILLLQQIQKDGNLNHALNEAKGGKAEYFKYLNKDVLPLYYDQRDYQYFTHINF